MRIYYSVLPTEGRTVVPLGTDAWGSERGKSKETFINFRVVTPAPYLVRGKLQRESSNVKNLWIPAFAGMTF